MADFSTAIRKLEFDKVVDRLRQLVASEPARALAAELLPTDDLQRIQLELQRVSEAKELLIAEGSAPCRLSLVELQTGWRKNQRLLG